jgi:hypothetical protein
MRDKCVSKSFCQFVANGVQSNTHTFINIVLYTWGGGMGRLHRMSKLRFFQLNLAKGHARLLG